MFLSKAQEDKASAKATGLIFKDYEPERFNEVLKKHMKDIKSGLLQKTLIETALKKGQVDKALVESIRQDIRDVSIFIPFLEHGLSLKEIIQPLFISEAVQINLTSSNPFEMSLKSLISMVIEQKLEKDFLTQILSLTYSEQNEDAITKKQIEATNFFISFLEEDLCPMLIEAIQEITSKKLWQCKVVIMRTIIFICKKNH